jgi:CBS-domain-containing membrane protein
MQGAQLQANGPYRFVRNPLYIGSLSTMVAVSTLMPPSGAVFVIVMVTLVYIVLIDGEERFLGAKLGQPYLDYCRAVPRIIPRMWRPLAASGAKADWLMGAVGEVNTIGIFLAFAILSWRFDRMLMVRAVLVCFGLSLVVRALLPRKAEAERQS